MSRIRLVHVTPRADWQDIVRRSRAALESAGVRAELYAESEPDVADAMRQRGVWVLCPRQGYLQ